MDQKQRDSIFWCVVVIEVVAIAWMCSTGRLFVSPAPVDWGLL